MQRLRSKVIENLAVVNYDTNNLILAPYDWRLTPYNLEERDGYFSRLKSTIEGFKLRILLFFFGHSDCLTFNLVSQEKTKKKVCHCGTFNGQYCAWFLGSRPPPRI